MKLTKRVLLFLSLFFLVLPLIVSAQGLDGFENVQVPTSSDTVGKVVQSVINWTFGILLIAAVFMILIASFVFMTAQGDPEKIKRARNIILYAVVAIVVAFLAEAFVVLIGKIIGAGGGGTPPEYF